MNTARYACCDEQRRTVLLNSVLATLGAVSGIDYLEVEAGLTTADPTLLHIVLVNPLSLPAATLTADNISLTGGVRYPAPRIDPVIAVSPGAGSVARYTITVPGNQPTDFSTYRLELLAQAGATTPPAFIDVRLAGVDFSFKGDCPSDFDCVPDCGEDTEPGPPEPEFDYRVRDYQGFRRQMLDRLAQLVPGFREDDPLDFTTTLVEAAAYRADQQSYRLDWVGTEAFLATARSRTSIARHARLVDYPPNEGASARVFARFEVGAGGEGAVLAAGTPLLVRSDGLPPVVPISQYRNVLARNPIGFETVAPLVLRQWRNHIAFHTWQDDECRLARGATAATLVDASNGNGPLARGDLLLLAETALPENGRPQDARADHRHVVRITKVTTATNDVLQPGLQLASVQWDEADALPFDLVIQSRPRDALGAAPAARCAEACANIMLADHGISLPPTVAGIVPDDVKALRPALVPASPVADEPWRPLLDRGDLARIEPVDLQALPQAPASALAAADPARCLPALALDDDFDTWTARRDLLASGRFARDFVIETAIDGRAGLRFGDDVNGQSPGVGASLAPRGRFGTGLAGNIGIGALAHVVVPLAQQAMPIVVTNPLPARDGRAPETIAEIRIAAPQAFRRQERAVSAADYAEVAKRHEGVANAVAVARWTGAWQTMMVYIDRRGGVALDEPFRREMLAHLERYRLMGFDVALRNAIAAPLEIELLVCARPNELRSAVGARVREALRPSGDGSGARGFFHADNFTFGSPLYLSKLIAAVMAVEGVQSVKARKFQRLRRLPANELAAGVIRPDGFEVLQLEDDPSFPERGRLALDIGGGR